MARASYSLNSYVGGATAALVSGTITAAATVITISGTSVTWGSLGSTGGWFGALNYGAINEEKIYVPSGLYPWSSGVVTLSGVVRGVDGTTASGFSGVKFVAPVLTATDLQEANFLVNTLLGNILVVSGQALLSNGTTLTFGTAVSSQFVTTAVGVETTRAETAEALLQPYANVNTAGKNALINGGMEIWQRGTSFSPTNSINYCNDRWCAQSTASNLTVSQGTSSPPTGFKYFTKIVATSTTSSTFFYGQSIESLNVIPFQGRVVTVSFQYQIPTNLSGQVQVLVKYSTGTDSNLVNAGTGVTATSGVNVDPSTGLMTNNSSWTPASITLTVPSTATSLAVQFSTSPNTVNAAEFDVTGVQLELGSVATPFSRAGGSIGGELALCQRYYCKSYDTATAPQTTSNSDGAVTVQGTSIPNNNAVASVQFPVTMRARPTVTVYSWTSATAATISNFATGADEAAGSGTVLYYGNSGFTINNQSGGTVTSAGGYFFHYVANAEL